MSTEQSVQRSDDDQRAMMARRQHPSNLNYPNSETNKKAGNTMETDYTNMGNVEAEIMAIVHDQEDHIRNCQDRIVTDGVVAPFSVDY